MGSFANYIGLMEIPEQFKSEFSGRILKILNYGGMMDIETVSMFQEKIELLLPIDINSNDNISFFYNYFEDDAWEFAGYKPEKCRLYSNKIGSFEFRNVILAAYTLYELYDVNGGITTVDGKIVSDSSIVGWFNHLFGTDFSMEHRKNVWMNAEKYISENEYIKKMEPSQIYELIPLDYMRYVGGVEFTDLCYSTNGTKTLTIDDVKRGSYPADILACKNSIISFLGSDKDESKAEMIYQLVCTDRQQREQTEDPELKEIAEWSLILPARSIVYLTAEIMQVDFWKKWREMDNVYHDEILKNYAHKKLIEKRNKGWKRPVAKVRTSDFLRESSPLAFWDTPDELADKPKYIVSDDDRLFWWDGSDEVIISKEMKEWMKKLSGRHKELVRSIEPDMVTNDSEDFLRFFLHTLLDVDEKYGRILPFQNMFYDFIANGYRKEYLAAVKLLNELSIDNQDEGNVIKNCTGSWWYTSRKITFNPGRLRMKRYMSLLANRKVRMDVFGF